PLGANFGGEAARDAEMAAARVKTATTDLIRRVCIRNIVIALLTVQGFQWYSEPGRDDGRVEAVVGLIAFVLHSQSGSFREPPPPLRCDHDTPGIGVRRERLEPEIRRVVLRDPDVLWRPEKRAGLIVSAVSRVQQQDG